MVKTKDKKKKKSKRTYKDIYKSSGLKAADLSLKGEVFEISDIADGEIEGNPKLFAYFKHDDRSWCLNQTNCEVLEESTGSDDPDSWVGLKVKLFNDKTVTNPNGGRGGIRIKDILNAPVTNDEDDDLGDILDDDE